jgi:succinate-semialdehyde dehydrogenase/glutarate-semialdehyde dehydrogenase
VSAITQPQIDFLDQPLRLYIDGAFVETDEGLATVNPATGETLATAPLATEREVDLAVAAAARAFETWRYTPPTQRARLLWKLADLLETNKDEFAEIEVLDNGKPLWEAQLVDVALTIELLRYYAGWTTKIQGDVLPNSIPGMLTISKREPVGVVAAITPWNFPLTLMANKICPALATGCTVVLKPASTTPLATQRAVEIINSAGLPPGVLNIVHGSGAEIGDALVSHPKVNKIAFTGQTETGKRIMKLAADHVTRITLELGGSDPMIVCDDADIRRASAATAIGRFFNAGQACLAVKRVYVFASVAEEFMAKIADRAKKEWKVGDGLTEGTKMGPLHTEHQRAEVEAQVADAVKKGAKVLAGGTRPEGKEFERGWFMEATVLTEVPDDSRMLTEEVFGPALPIVIVNDLDEAIAKANSSVYGLGSSIWTKDLAKARKAVEQIQAGYTWVNDIQVAYDQLPFGGAKQSGFGKEHGLEALDGYLEKKSVVLSAG